ncbi:tRNA-splicing endonuclease subunit Sen2p [Monosporozyma unispora]
MVKHNARSNNVRYKYPLPIHPVDTTSLPHLILQNPLSWIHWSYKYYKLVCNSTNLCDRINVEITGGDIYPHVMVEDAQGMTYLWENGFFGTGTLSRSEPTWFNRTDKLVNGTEGWGQDSQLEKITRNRRLERSEFKKLREKLENELLILRQQSNGDESLEKISEVVLKQREQLRAFKASQEQNHGDEGDNTVNDLEFDEQMFDDEGNLLPLESLELMPVEATFLTFALPVLNITPTQLFQRVLTPTPTYETIHNFIIQYASYHHYRSHGWCVRSGIKFGCDYLLYKRGPPFQHAEFCITVMDNDSPRDDYTWYSRISRVIGGAKKTWILSYVSRTTSKEQIMKWWEKEQYHKVFHAYEVNEIIYKRWVPGKNRD